jgi:MFS transporter, MHS family, proline/betaine transporter
MQLLGAYLSLIMGIGSSARRRLRETPEFADMKLRIKKTMEDFELNDKKKMILPSLKQRNPLWKEKVNLKTALAYFLISCGFPACFYLSYIYCGHILKNNFSYTSDQIIQQNLIVSIFQSLSFLIYSICSHKINPLKILKFRIYVFLPFVIISPYLLNHFSTVYEILIFQCFIMTFGVMDCPGAGVFISHFPIAKRFTSLGLIYAFSRISIYIITSFGFVYLTKWFSSFGVFIIMTLITAGFIWGVKHFQELENNIPKIFCAYR